MKLATYQPMKNTHKKTSDYSEFEKILGYKPIFCISAENYNDLLVQSILAAPFCPQLIYFFETDDFHTFDVAEYNSSKQYDENKKRVVKIDKEASNDARCLEYLVKEIPQDAVCFNIYETIKELEMNELPASTPAFSFLSKMIMSMAAQTFQQLNFIIKNDNYYANHKVDKFYFSSDETCQPLLQVLKIGYESFGLYFDYCCWLNEKNLDFSEGLNNIALIRPAFQSQLVNEYNSFKYEGGQSSIQAHISLYEDIKNYIKANNIAYEAIRHINNINANSKCSCGSGKKYKKCCQPYVIDKRNVYEQPKKSKVF